MEQIKHRDEIIGSKIQARIRKNKMARPFTAAKLSIIYGEGISQEIELLEDALKAGVITRRGSHYYHDDHSIGMGPERVRLALREDGELASAVREGIQADE